MIQSGKTSRICMACMKTSQKHAIEIYGLFFSALPQALRLEAVSSV